jgi:hypothetical protein
LFRKSYGTKNVSVLIAGSKSCYARARKYYKKELWQIIYDTDAWWIVLEDKIKVFAKEMPRS